MTISTSQAEDYLAVVGRFVVPDNVDDRMWLLVFANAFANGFVKFDWDSAQGAVTMGLIEEVYGEFEDWCKTEGIRVEDFRRT